MTTDFESAAQPIETLDAAAIRGRLDAVRQRTLGLVAPLDWGTLRRQHVPILSPMVWDLGHIGHFEELWLVQTLGHLPPMADGYDRLFDAVRNPRPTREALPLPGRRELWRYLERVRQRTEEVIGGLGNATPARPSVVPELLADGFVYEMLAEHEEQHQETLLQAMQVLEGPAYSPVTRREPPELGAAGTDHRPRPGAMVTVPAGPFLMGAADGRFAYDNERRCHEVGVDGFSIDAAPVTNGDFLLFVQDGGYERRENWSAAGLAWLGESRARAPANWQQGHGGWRVRYMDRVMKLPEHRPVVHVCYHEADAFARWSGKRLPTEPEWEKAALWDPVAGRSRRYPGRRAADRASRQPRPARVRPGGGRVLSRRGQCLRPTSGPRRCLGVDLLRLRRLPRLSRLPVCRLLGDLLWCRVQGAARRLLGHPSRGGARHPSQLGLPDPPADLLRLSLRARRVGLAAAASRFLQSASVESGCAELVHPQ